MYESVVPLPSGSLPVEPTSLRVLSFSRPTYTSTTRGRSAATSMSAVIELSMNSETYTWLLQRFQSMCFWYALVTRHVFQAGVWACKHMRQCSAYSVRGRAFSVRVRQRAWLATPTKKKHVCTRRMAEYCWRCVQYRCPPPRAISYDSTSMINAHHYAQQPRLLGQAVEERLQFLIRAATCVAATQRSHTPRAEDWS